MINGFDFVGILCAYNFSWFLGRLWTRRNSRILAQLLSQFRSHSVL